MAEDKPIPLPVLDNSHKFQKGAQRKQERRKETRMSDKLQLPRKKWKKMKDKEGRRACKTQRQSERGRRERGRE